MTPLEPTSGLPTVGTVTSGANGTGLLPANLQPTLAAQAQAQAVGAGMAYGPGTNVFDYYQNLFAQEGMADLGKVLPNILKNSNSADQVMEQVRNTPEYAARFPGNIALRDSGQGMLSEASYLGLEQSYRSSMKTAGLPSGYFDKPSDFGGFIANNVSPSEVGQRATDAMTLVNTKDPALVNQFSNYFGISRGHLAAYFLDPKGSMPLLQKQFDAANIGAEATRAGLNAHSGFATQLVDQGVTQGNARAAFDSTARDATTLGKFADMAGTKIGVNQIVDSKLGLSQATTAKISHLTDEESSRFAGTSEGQRGLASGVAVGKLGQF